MEIELSGRARFISLWRPKAGMENDKGETNEPKYRLALIIERDSEDFKIAYNALVECGKEGWKQNYEAVLGAMERSKKFLRDGSFILKKDGSTYPEMVGKIVIQTSSKARPTVWDTDGVSPLSEADGRPYDGCYVRIKCDPYPYPKFGSIPCTLRGVQFWKEGDAFGPAPTPQGGFSSLAVPQGAGAKPPAGTPGGLF